MQIGRPFGVQNLGSAKVKQGRVLRRELMYPAAGGGGTEASSAALLRFCSSLLYIMKGTAGAYLPYLLDPELQKRRCPTLRIPRSQQTPGSFCAGGTGSNRGVISEASFFGSLCNHPPRFGRNTHRWATGVRRCASQSSIRSVPGTSCLHRMCVPSDPGHCRW